MSKPPQLALTSALYASQTLAVRSDFVTLCSVKGIYNAEHWQERNVEPLSSSATKYGSEEILSVLRDPRDHSECSEPILNTAGRRVQMPK